MWIGSKSHCSISFVAFAIIREMSRNIFSTACANVGQKSAVPIWVWSLLWSLLGVNLSSPQIDLKATALLKLVYLEMFGHDMSWASFNVLEVMSSPKYLQKRVGYLGAVQSFRPDTEVLMLATNLLKKVSLFKNRPRVPKFDMQSRTLTLLPFQQFLYRWSRFHMSLRLPWRCLFWLTCCHDCHIPIQAFARKRWSHFTV